MEVFVLDKNLKRIAVVDAYKSLIWANRYKDLGDCELYLEANTDNRQYLVKGNYLYRPDDLMVCQIRKVEIDTSIKEGNYLIVTGTDCKALLDQRIIWNTETCDGPLEDFIRYLVSGSCINPVMSARKFKKANGNQLLYLATAAGFTTVLSEQVSYKNLGEKIREYCENNGWGYRFYLDSEKLYFQLYKGTDRSALVRFTPNFENVSTSKFVSDSTNLGNVALIGGEGEGNDRAKEYTGTATSTDRFEIWVDAKDITRNISYAELLELYPDGYISGLGYYVSQLDIPIIDNQHLAQLQAKYLGTVVTIGGIRYYRLTNVKLATLENSSPDDNSTVILEDVLYSSYLLNKGLEKLTEYGEKTSFEGQVIPDVTFVYKQDYFLGDIVTIENEFASARARITEIIEVDDQNGYRVEPTFSEVV